VKRAQRKDRLSGPYEWVNDPRRWSINLGQRRLKTSSPNWWKAYPERIILSQLTHVAQTAIKLWARRIERLSPKQIDAGEMLDGARALEAVMRLWFAAEGLHSPADDGPEPEFNGRKLSEMSKEELIAVLRGAVAD